MKVFIFIIVGFLNAHVFAQTKFTASISPNEVSKNEYITLKLTVQNGKNIRSIIPPNLSDFIVVSGPNQEQSSVNINGVVTESFSESYILQPKKLGSFTLCCAEAIINNKLCKSNMVKVLVSLNASKKQFNTNTSPFAGIDFFEEAIPQKQYADYILKPSDNIEEKIKKNMEVKLITDKTTCYVGEPILATYKLFTRLPCESNIIKNPSFNGFSVIDLLQQTQQNNGEHEILNGRDYKTFTLRKVQLYPLQPGNIVVESAGLKNNITFLTYANDGNKSILSHDANLYSKEAIIKVVPLPIANKPIDFCGSVGEYAINATVEKSNFSTDETGKLSITISGKGNMQLLTIPKLQLPNSIEVFETKTIENIDNTSIPLNGSKTFEVPFVINKEGNYTIPAINFSFFNSKNKAYKSINTKDIALTITKGSQKRYNIKNAKISQQNINWVLISVIALPFLLLTTILIFKKKKKPNEIATQVEITKTENERSIKTKNYFEKVELLLNNNITNQFFIELHTAFKKYLADTFLPENEILTLQNLKQSMIQKRVADITIQHTQQLLQEIEQKFYSPFLSQHSNAALYQKIKELIASIS